MDTCWYKMFFSKLLRSFMINNCRGTNHIDGTKFEIWVSEKLWDRLTKVLVYIKHPLFSCVFKVYKDTCPCTPWFICLFRRLKKGRWHNPLILPGSSRVSADLCPAMETRCITYLSSCRRFLGPGLYYRQDTTPVTELPRVSVSRPGLDLDLPHPSTIHDRLPHKPAAAQLLAGRRSPGWHQRI